MDSNTAPKGDRERLVTAYPHRPWPRFVATGLILLAFGLMLSSAVRKSATVDEQSHLFRGVAYLRDGATHFLLGHPLLGGTLSAIPLLTEADLRLPTATSAWETGDWSVSGDAFMWQLNAEPLRLIFLGRLPVIWLTLLLGALVFRWGREWAGPGAGLLALVLVLLDPNVMAHGRLITGDLPLVLFYLLTLYGYWCWARSYVQRPSCGLDLLKQRSSLYLLLSGAGLGLAGATKFNAALLLPVLAVWAGVLAWRRRSLTPLLAVVLAGLTAWITIWALYGFALWRGYLPGGAFWDDVLWQATYVGEQHGVYLMGEISAGGWLSYFPIAFGLKTPLITLALLLLALILLMKRPSGSVGLYLLLPAAIYFAGSMMVALNIGYRYLLPMLPILFLAVAVTLAKNRRLKRRMGLWLPTILVVLVLLAIWTWPDYIPFYNIAVGRASWTILSDSNVDWGQDLPGLQAWQKKNDTRVQLSYFGTAHPSAYGVRFDPLPSWPAAPEQGDPAAQFFNPADPAPGYYAISVTNLHGAVLGQDRDSYAFFRDMTPVEKIGNSIFIYLVPARGEGVNVAYSGVKPADLQPELHAHFETNDLRSRRFDGSDSLIWPVDGGWLAVGDDSLPDSPELAALWPDEPMAEADGQALYLLNEPTFPDWASIAIDFGGLLTYLGHGHLAEDEAGLSLLTAWRSQQASDRPLKIFVHALDSEGSIIGQWDGLSVAPDTLHPGDTFFQEHSIEVPGDVPAVELRIGLYDGATLERIGAPAVIPLQAPRLVCLLPDCIIPGHIRW